MCMRKINSLYLVCLFLISFAACKKDSGSGGSSNYYIKANIAGTEKNYTSTPMAIAINQGGTYSLSMDGFPDQSNQWANYSGYLQ